MKHTGALKAATHLFCFISFIGIYYPLTDIVIIHIFYINESNPYTPLIDMVFIHFSYIYIYREREVQCIRCSFRESYSFYPYQYF